MKQGWNWKRRGYDGRTDRERVARLFRHHIATRWNPRGRIVRLICAFCKPNTQETPSQAHHVDYARPFLVCWACERHHRAIKRKDVKVTKAKLCDYTSLVTNLLRPGASVTLRARAARKPLRPTGTAPF